MTIPQLEVAVLVDVVTDFMEFKKSTPRRPLLIKFLNQPAAEAIGNLLNQNIIRRKDTNVATVDEEYLPAAAAFHFCGESRFREEAKLAATVVLQALQRMFVPERRTEGFVFDDLRKQVAKDNPNRIFEDATLKLGLYLVRDLGKLASSQLSNPDQTEVNSFQVGEAVTNMPDPEGEWDKAMAGFGRRVGLPVAGEEGEEAGGVVWEEIRRLGGGGQSEVFLVRCPTRVTERTRCLRRIQAALNGNDSTELANAISAYTRSESQSELGAMKRFKIRPEGGEEQPLQRLQQEMSVLKQGRPGLPRLLDSNASERWIVTEFFPRGTVEDNISVYKGKPDLALKAFLSLVNTVTQLHDEDMVHRDIKPANVFVRQDRELVLGDFGIVYLPNQPARLTRTDESVGPRDFMPPWADVGGRLENVDNKFDVYALGKLLWCMVSGRLVLLREYFKEPENDVTLMLRQDPHGHMINEILEKCLVERVKNCMGIHDMRAMVIAFVGTLEQGGQLLHDDVPRPCHVCGHGQYQPETFGEGGAHVPVNMRFWQDQNINLKKVQVFVCDGCGHVALFRTFPR